MRADDTFPLENPGCGGKASLMLAGLAVMAWRWLR